MKRFSNIEEKAKIISEQKPKLNNLVEYLVKENLQVSFTGDVDDVVTNKFTIDGTDELVEKINTYIEKCKIETEKLVLENIKYTQAQYFYESVINDQIKFETSKIYPDMIPFPHDIFSSVDYDKLQENTIVLKSLSNIPTSYMDHVNYDFANKYFESGNNIILKYSNGWELIFESNGNYGTPIDDTDVKYKLFLHENKDFVADFLTATTELIGTKNIKIEKRLTTV